MRPPTEADLAELENLVLRDWQQTADNHPFYGTADRVVKTLEYLIARARYHNKREAERQAERIGRRIRA